MVSDTKLLKTRTANKMGGNGGNEGEKLCVPKLQLAEEPGRLCRATAGVEIFWHKAFLFFITKKLRFLLRFPILINTTIPNICFKKHPCVFWQTIAAEIERWSLKETQRFGAVRGSLLSVPFLICNLTAMQARLEEDRVKGLDESLGPPKYLLIFHQSTYHHYTVSF